MTNPRAKTVGTQAAARATGEDGTTTMVTKRSEKDRQLGCINDRIVRWWPGKSTGAYRFGDLLALARQSWITQMADGLTARGYADYRRSDAASVRQLQRGPMSIGRLGAALGVTRQAARKVADGLVLRGFASQRHATAATPGRSTSR